ncbi:hypothetical protein [Bartonella sp. CL45QHWL]|uniref:hypothetical protein n=1 Tax=Bartonella sp. CL45QHWL TaxID=3243533 RepID=UPI0035CFAAF4
MCGPAFPRPFIAFTPAPSTVLPTRSPASQQAYWTLRNETKRAKWGSAHYFFIQPVLVPMTCDASTWVCIFGINS